jgi:hypothetical protein
MQQREKQKNTGRHNNYRKDDDHINCTCCKCSEQVMLYKYHVICMLIFIQGCRCMDVFHVWYSYVHIFSSCYGMEVLRIALLGLWSFHFHPIRGMNKTLLTRYGKPRFMASQYKERLFHTAKGSFYCAKCKGVHWIPTGSNGAKLVMLGKK